METCPPPTRELKAKISAAVWKYGSKGGQCMGIPIFEAKLIEHPFYNSKVKSRIWDQKINHISINLLHNDLENWPEGKDVSPGEFAKVSIAGQTESGKSVSAAKSRKASDVVERDGSPGWRRRVSGSAFSASRPDPLFPSPWLWIKPVNDLVRYLSSLDWSVSSLIGGAALR